MKKIWFLFILFFPATGLFAQDTLEINISGIRNAKGEILLQLYDSQHNLTGQAKGKPVDGKCIIRLGNIKPGRYAVRYFHDENLSGKLEINLIGIPKEGFGYSNNAAAVIGPPSFDKWLFDLNGNKKLELKITYL